MKEAKRDDERGRKMSDGEKRNGKDDRAVGRETLVKATPVHELRENVCLILFLHRSLVLKTIYGLKRSKTAAHFV